MVSSYLRLLFVAIVAIYPATHVFAADDELVSEIYNVFVAKFYVTEVGSSNLVSEKESLKRIQEQIDQQSEIGALKLNELNLIRVFPESQTVCVRATSKQHALFLKHIAAAQTNPQQIDCQSWILLAPVDSLKLLLETYDFQYAASNNHLYAYAKTPATKEEIEKRLETWGDQGIRIISRPRIVTVDNQLVELRIGYGTHYVGVQFKPQLTKATNEILVELGMFEAVSTDSEPSFEPPKIPSTLSENETLILIDLRPSSLAPDPKGTIKMMFLTPRIVERDNDEIIRSAILRNSPD